MFGWRTMSIRKRFFFGLQPKWLFTTAWMVEMSQKCLLKVRHESILSVWKIKVCLGEIWFYFLFLLRNSYLLSNRASLTCLQRTDDQKKLFGTYIRHVRALPKINLFQLLPIDNGNVVCSDNSYPIKNLCDKSKDDQQCQTSLTKQTINLNPK